MRAWTTGGERVHEVVVSGPAGFWEVKPATPDRQVTLGAPMSGFGWQCACGQAGFGYVTEGEAEDFADAHTVSS